MKKPEPFKKRYTTRRVVIPKDGYILDGIPAASESARQNAFGNNAEIKRGDSVRGRAL